MLRSNIREGSLTRFLAGLVMFRRLPGGPQKVLEGSRGAPGGSPYLWEKTVWNSLSMSSTIWLWNTMWIVILDDSVWGRSKVGPNTMATLWTDILLDSLCSITLEREKVKNNNYINSCIYTAFLSKVLYKGFAAHSCTHSTHRQHSTT